MPRVLTAAVSTHITQNVTTLALCMRVVRNDGVTTYHTTHDKNIDFGGNTYLAGASFTPTNMRQTADFRVNDMDILGILSASDKLQVDIRAGLYDSCHVYMFYVNYNSPAAGAVNLFHGFLGNVTIRDGAYTAEIRSVHQQFNRSVVRRYSPMCNVDFGSTKCGVSLATYTFTAEVVYQVESREKAIVKHVGGPYTEFEQAGYFNGGKAVWTGGNNNGFTSEIKWHHFNSDTFAVAATANSNDSNRSTNTLTANLPTGITAGSLVVVAVSNFGRTSDVSWPAGWAGGLFHYNAGAHIACAYRHCDGSEGSTISVGVDDSSTCARAWRIEGAASPSLIVPESVTYEGLSGTSHNPPELVTTSGADTYIYFAIDAMDNYTGTYLSFPSGYSGTGQHAENAGAGAVRIGYGYKIASAASENPGAFGISISSPDYCGIVFNFAKVLGPEIEFLVPVPYSFGAGDTLNLVKGCDKKFVTCRDTYNNAPNFRGFPEIPGRTVLVNGENAQ